MHPIYTEVPIEGNAVRLLRLEPTLGYPDATVCCSLYTMSLDDSPEYDALSYCWGDYTEPRNIKVNGYDIEVTSNLESALRHMRRTELPRSLWVDALCINQQDIAERSSQVALMHEIYRRATRTRAWLGDDRSSGEFALEFLTWYAGRKALINQSDIDGHHKDYELEGWSAVNSLMQRKYWRRLWVMQEIALSRSQPLVICGKKSILWHNLILALGSGDLAHYAMRLNRVRGATNRYSKHESAISSATQGRHIIFLLSHSSGFDTTVPVDRVYALYGLLRVAGIVDFQPDYTKTLAEVFQESTAYAILRKGGLDMLELRSHEQHDDLVSWVVDLSKQPPRSLPVPGKCLWKRSNSDDFDATTSPSLGIDVHLTQLSVTGTVIDEVASVDPIPACLATAFRRAMETPDVKLFNGESLRLSNSSALEYWIQMQDQRHGSSLCLEAIDYLFTYQDAVDFICADSARSALSWLPRLWDWKQMLKEAPTCDMLQATSVGEAGDNFDTRYWNALTPLLCTLALMLHGRVFCRTEKDYVSASLVGVQPGDQIIAFQSTKQLHILRPVEGFYQYVGAALLAPPSQAPNGTVSTSLSSLFAKVRNKTMEDQTFVIR